MSKLFKLPLPQIAQAMAASAQKAWNSLAQFLKPFVPKKHLTPGEPITENNWDAIASLLTDKLELDEGQLEEIKQQALALAGDGPLTVAHLIQALEAGGYAVDGLLPPVQKKAYKPAEIEQIKKKFKDEGYQQGREEASTEFTEKIEQIQQEHQRQVEQMQHQLLKQQQESEARFHQLEQQLQTLQRRMPTQIGSTVGAQALDSLLEPTGKSHRAMTVPPSLSQRDFQGSPQKVKPSQKTPSLGKGFGQSVNQKHRRYG